MKKRILIVEDNFKKLEKIREVLERELSTIEICEKTSYNAANKEIALNHAQYDLILLDMSMQTYDISQEETGGDAEPLAGKNILNQMYLRHIPTKVIVVTMYENFVDGTRLKMLDEELKSKYSENYFGYIFFSHTHTEWTEQLVNQVTKILEQ